MAYLRKVSNSGQWSKSSCSKLSDPGARSLVEFNAAVHQRSHSDSDRYRTPADVTPAAAAAAAAPCLGPAAGVVSAATSSSGGSSGWLAGGPESDAKDSKMLSVKVSTLPRRKRPEELVCDQLSKDLMDHLSPSDKLHAILSGQFLSSSFLHGGRV